MCQYQDPSTLQEGHTKSPVLILKMLSCRQVAWAEGTEFMPGFTDHGRIAVKINLNHEGDFSTYENLTKWMRRNVFPGAVKSINDEDATRWWKHVSRSVPVSPGRKT